MKRIVSVLLASTVVYTTFDPAWASQNEEPNENLGPYIVYMRTKKTRRIVTPRRNTVVPQFYNPYRSFPSNPVEELAIESLRHAQEVEERQRQRLQYDQQIAYNNATRIEAERMALAQAQYEDRENSVNQQNQWRQIVPDLVKLLRTPVEPEPIEKK